MSDRSTARSGPIPFPIVEFASGEIGWNTGGVTAPGLGRDAVRTQIKGRVALGRGAFVGGRAVMCGRTDPSSSYGRAFSTGRIACYVLDRHGAAEAIDLPDIVGGPIQDMIVLGKRVAILFQTDQRMCVLTFSADQEFPPSMWYVPRVETAGAQQSKLALMAAGDRMAAVVVAKRADHWVTRILYVGDASPSVERRLESMNTKPNGTALVIADARGEKRTVGYRAAGGAASLVNLEFTEDEVQGTSWSVEELPHWNGMADARFATRNGAVYAIDDAVERTYIRASPSHPFVRTVFKPCGPTTRLALIASETHGIRVLGFNDSCAIPAS